MRSKHELDRAAARAIVAGKLSPDFQPEKGGRTKERPRRTRKPALGFER